MRPLASSSWRDLLSVSLPLNIDVTLAFPSPPPSRADMESAASASRARYELAPLAEIHRLSESKAKPGTSSSCSAGVLPFFLQGRLCLGSRGGTSVIEEEHPI